MIVAGSVTGASVRNTIPATSFTKPVNIFHSSQTFAITDSTDLSLMGGMPVRPYPVPFVVRAVALTAYANGDGSSPTLTLNTASGGSGSQALFSNGTAAAAFQTVEGVLQPGETLQLHPVAGTGTTETGTARVTCTLYDCPFSSPSTVVGS